MNDPSKPDQGLRAAPFYVGEWLVDPSLNSISRGTENLRLEPKTVQVLVCLAEHAGGVVSKEGLIHTVWPDTFVTDQVLTTAIYQLRQAFGEDARSSRLIQTIPKAGYRLTAKVGSVSTGAAHEELAASPTAPAIVRARRRRAMFGVTALLVLLCAVAAGYFWLRRPRATSLPSARVLVAVLPFLNLSGDPGQEYFSDGMTEELLTQLGRMNPARLGVIARTSSMRYKGRTEGIDQIGRELGVDYVLEGSVRRERSRVRISVQLIQVRDQTHLWAANYERDLAEVFSVQDDVSRRVADSLAMQLLDGRGAVLARAPTTDPEAYEAYLRGRYFWNQRTEAGLLKARAVFEQAIARDPGYALAYAGLADTLSSLGNYRFVPAREAYPRARAAAEKALQLDPELAEAHTSLADTLAEYDWDWAGAEKEYRRALELNPGYSTAHQFFAFILLSRLGRHEEAMAEMRKARELDPLSPLLIRQTGLFLYRARRYDEAIAELRHALELNPEDPWTHIYLGHVYLMKPEAGDAAAEFQRAMALLPDAPWCIASVALTEVAAGRPEKARQLLSRLLALDRQKGIAASDIAQVYFALGDKSTAFRWLMTACERRDPNMFVFASYPYWESLRPDPRFQDFLRRINWPQTPPRGE